MKAVILTKDEAWYREFSSLLQGEGVVTCRITEDKQSWTEEIDKPDAAVMAVVYLQWDNRLFSVIANLSQKGLPVMVLTAQESSFEEMQCLAAGAADYQSKDKPFSVLWQRLQILPAKAEWSGKVYDVAGLGREPRSKTFTIAGKSLDLTPKERDVLECLLQERGKTVSRSRLMQNVWNGELPDNTRALDTIIKQLRSKLKESGISIRTHYGSGYSITHNC